MCLQPLIVLHFAHGEMYSPTGFTHFCSKPSISLSSRIFSSGSQVLCLNKDEATCKHTTKILHQSGINPHFQLNLRTKMTAQKHRQTPHLKRRAVHFIEVKKDALTSLPILSILPGIQVVPASKEKKNKKTRPVDKQKQLATRTRDFKKIPQIWKSFAAASFFFCCSVFSFMLIHILESFGFCAQRRKSCMLLMFPHTSL